MGQAGGGCLCLSRGQAEEELACPLGRSQSQTPTATRTPRTTAQGAAKAATTGPISEVTPAACIAQNSELYYDAWSSDEMPSSSGCRGSWTRDEIVAAGVSMENVDGVAALSAELRVNCLEPLCDPHTLQRWYIARDKDVMAAAAMYRSAMRWRMDYAIGLVMAMHGKGEHYENVVSPMREHDTLTWRWQRNPEASYEARLTQRHAFFGRLRQIGGDGEPILVWRVGEADIGSLEREGLVEGFKRALVAHLEDTLQTTREACQRSKRMVLARLVIDAQGISLALIRNISLIKRLLSFSFDYFPEGVSTVTVVRAPGIVTHAWRLISPVLPPRSRAKFRIIGKDFAAGLREHAGLELQVLPELLGGNASDSEVCATLPVPLGLGATVATPRFHLALNAH